MFVPKSRFEAVETGPEWTKKLF